MSTDDGNVRREEPNSIEEFLVRMDEKIDRLSTGVVEITRRLTALDEDMVGQLRRLDRISSRLDVIEQRVGARGEDGTPR